MFQLVNLTPSEFDSSGKQSKKVHIPRVTHKRDRKALSCQPCRKMKVSCDRHTPCQRCSKNKRDDHCVYEPDPRRRQQPLEQNHAREVDGHGLSRKRVRLDDEDHSDTMSDYPDSTLKTLSVHASTRASETSIYKEGAYTRPGSFYYRDGKAKFAGGSHWNNMAAEINKVREFLKDGSGMDQLQKELKEVKKLYKNHWTKNFPFEFSQRKPIDEILSLLPARDEVERLSITYLETIERTHRLLHVPSFWAEMETFWLAPEKASNGWLGQLFMMIAIASQIERIADLDCTPSEERLQLDAISQLLEGAQTCLMSTQFMWKPSIEGLRTLCMIVIAKQMDMITLSDSDTPWILTGVISRLAMSLGFHRDGENFTNMPLFEREMRRRLWITIVYLEVQNSIDGGLPLAINVEDYDSQTPMNINDRDINPICSTLSPEATHTNEDYTDSTCQLLIADSYPVVLKIVSRANSAAAGISYDEVLEYDKLMRMHTEAVTKSLRCENIKTSAEGVEEAMTVQLIFIDKYLRRVRRTIHRVYAQLPNARNDYPLSYFASLDCSFAFLVHRRTFSEGSLHTSSQGSWLTEMLKDDFTHSIMVVFAELRLKRCRVSKDPMVANIDPEETMFQALKACHEIAAREIGISTHHMRMHLLLGVMIASLEAGSAGTEQALKMLKNAFRNTIRLVKIKKGAECETGATSPDNNKYGQVILDPVPLNLEVSGMHLENFFESIQFPMNYMDGIPVNVMDIFQYFLAT